MPFKKSNLNLQLTRWSLHAVFTLLLAIAAYAAQSHWLAAMKMDRDTISNEIRIIKKQLEKTESITAEHTRLVELKNSIEKRTASVEDRIPDHPSEGEFLKQTTNAAEQCNIHIDEYRRSGIESDGDHSRLIIRMSVDGPFAGLCRFLHELEQLPRLSKVCKMDIKNKSLEDDTYPMDLTLTLFFRSIPAQERIARASND